MDDNIKITTSQISLADADIIYSIIGSHGIAMSWLSTVPVGDNITNIIYCLAWV